MKRVLIIGATSAIAEALARRYAAAGARLYLVARDGERLESMKADLTLRGAETVGGARLDVNELERHEAVIDGALEALGGIDLALVAHGTLPDQRACEADFSLALRELNTNALSVVSLLTHLANRLEAQGAGTLAAISSVAGDRGRQSNYLYGSAKGMVSLFLAGLRNRLHRSGVHVLTIKPGFVDTPMTADFPKGPLWASPDRVARDIERAVERRREVLFTPWFWRYIMWIIRAIPEPIFKRMSL